MHLRPAAIEGAIRLLDSPAIVSGRGTIVALAENEIAIAGAGGGNRTLTTLRSRDFESRASASFTTPAGLCDVQDTPSVSASRFKSVPARRGLLDGDEGLCASGD